MSDDDIWRPAAAAMTRRRSTRPSTARSTTQGQPTVLLIKTVKGLRHGQVRRGKNTAHQTKS